MKKSKLPNLISVMILTLITSLMWVSFNIYRALTSKAPPSVSAQVSQPLTPTLDKDALDLIQGKLYLNDSQIPDNVAAGTGVPTVTLSGICESFKYNFPCMRSSASLSKVGVSGCET